MNNMLFCGDTFLRTRDGSDPFQFIRSLFKEHGNVCINLETALVGNKLKKKNVCLCVDYDSLNVLENDIQVVSIVNNHINDGEDPNILVKHLQRMNKIVIGPKNPSITKLSFKTISIDIISAYYSLPKYSITYNNGITKKITKMIHDSTAERKILFLHWGYEHSEAPAPFQRELAKKFIDKGADIIIGNHPHVSQGWELYKNSKIFYSLGNFNFWQLETVTNDNNRWGYLVSYDLELNDAKIIPYIINENYQPIIIEKDIYKNIMHEIDLLNKKLLNINKNEWFQKYYSRWYYREYKVWMLNIKKYKTIKITIMFILWLILPLQLEYYFNIIICKMIRASKCHIH